MGERDRNSSSTRPAAEQLGVQVRPALAQQRAHVRSDRRSSAAPRAGRASRPRARRARSRPAAAVVGQAGLRGGQDRDARLGVGEQRHVRREREAPGDDAGERFLGAGRARARSAAAVGIGDDPAVALGAHRAGARHDGVDDRAQPVEQLAVGGVCRSAPSARRASRARRAVLTMFSSTYGRSPPARREHARAVRSCRPRPVDDLLGGGRRAARGSRRLSVIGSRRWRSRYSNLLNTLDWDDLLRSCCLAGT